MCKVTNYFTNMHHFFMKMTFYFTNCYKCSKFYSVFNLECYEKNKSLETKNPEYYSGLLKNLKLINDFKKSKINKSKMLFSCNAS